MTEKVDKVGAFASTLCAIHCAVCAFLPAALKAGALGTGFLVGREKYVNLLIGHDAEWVFTLVAVAFAGLALIFGWRKHQSIRVAGLLMLGILGLLASRAIEMGSGHGEEGHGEAYVEAGHHDNKSAARTKTDEHKTDGHQKDGHKKDGHKKDGQNKDDHKNDGHKDEHGGDHDGIGHMIGTLVGVLAGLILLIGHIFNIRETRRCKDDCTA